MYAYFWRYLNFSVGLTERSLDAKKTAQPVQHFQ